MSLPIIVFFDISNAVILGVWQTKPPARGWRRNAAVAGCDYAQPAIADEPRPIGNGSLHMTMRFCSTTSSVTKTLTFLRACPILAQLFVPSRPNALDHPRHISVQVLPLGKTFTILSVPWFVHLEVSSCLGTNSGMSRFRPIHLSFATCGPLRLMSKPRHSKSVHEDQIMN
jgi:hypothetical protein